MQTQKKQIQDKKNMDEIVLYLVHGGGGWSSQFLPLNLQQQKQWYEMLHLYKDFSIVWIEYVFLWQMHFVAIYM